MHPKLSARIEALLFTRDTPLTEVVLAQTLAASSDDISAALAELAARYEHSAMAVVRVAGGWRLQLREAYFADLQALSDREPPRYSRAFWETLAYIAYHQPCTRADIDAVRGVSTSSGVYRQLFDLGWIRVCGHREVPGRPELLATSGDFLDDFALKALDELPVVMTETPETGEENEGSS